MTHIKTSTGKRRFVNRIGLKGLTELVDTEMPARTLAAQEEWDGKDTKVREPRTALGSSITEEKRVLNAAKGVIHGQIK